MALEPRTGLYCLLRVGRWPSRWTRCCLCSVLGASEATAERWFRSDAPEVFAKLVETMS